MKRKILILSLILFNVLIAKGQKPTIDITKFYTIGNSIIVEYELKNFSSTKKINTVLYFEKKSNGTNINCEPDALSGDIGDIETIEGKKEIVWDLSKDAASFQEEIKPILVCKIKETSQLKSYLYSNDKFTSYFYCHFEYKYNIVNKIKYIDYQTKDLIFNQSNVGFNTFRFKNTFDDEDMTSFGLSYSFSNPIFEKRIHKFGVFGNFNILQWYFWDQSYFRFNLEAGYDRINTQKTLYTYMSDSKTVEQKYFGSWHLGIEANFTPIGVLGISFFGGVNQGSDFKLAYLISDKSSRNSIYKSNFYFGIGINLLPVFHDIDFLDLLFS